LDPCGWHYDKEGRLNENRVKEKRLTRGDNLYRLPVQVTQGERLRMPIQRTYTNARANLAELLDQVVDNHEVVIISRKGSEDVALISASELSSLQETAHLLRSPRNARRLLSALDRAQSRTVEPQSVGDVKRSVGLEKKR
jgi:antitoxin YefM